MSLSRNRSEPVDRSRRATLEPWLAASGEALVMISMAAGVCLSWPKVGRSMLLATKIVFYYCFSPR